MVRPRKSAGTLPTSIYKSDIYTFSHWTSKLCAFCRLKITIRAACNQLLKLIKVTNVAPWRIHGSNEQLCSDSSVKGVNIAWAFNKLQCIYKKPSTAQNFTGKNENTTCDPGHLLSEHRIFTTTEPATFKMSQYAWKIKCLHSRHSKHVMPAHDQLHC